MAHHVLARVDNGLARNRADRATPSGRSPGVSAASSSRGAARWRSSMRRSRRGRRAQSACASKSSRRARPRTHASCNRRRTRMNSQSRSNAALTCWSACWAQGRRRGPVRWRRTQGLRSRDGHETGGWPRGGCHDLASQHPGRCWTCAGPPVRRDFLARYAYRSRSRRSTFRAAGGQGVHAAVCTDEGLRRPGVRGASRWGRRMEGSEHSSCEQWLQETLRWARQVAATGRT